MSRDLCWGGRNLYWLWFHCHYMNKWNTIIHSDSWKKFAIFRLNFCLNHLLYLWNIIWFFNSFFGIWHRINNLWDGISKSFNLITSITLFANISDSFNNLWCNLGCWVYSILHLWVAVKCFVCFIFDNLSNIGSNIWDHICNTIWWLFKFLNLCRFFLLQLEFRFSWLELD